MAMAAIAAVGCLAGVLGLRAPESESQSALTIANIEALADTENSSCRWERVKDECGCTYHVCILTGDGDICSPCGASK